MSLPIRVGIQYESDDPIHVQREVWQAADEAGIDQLWTSDHLRRVPSSGDPNGPILDSWTTLAAVASATRRIRLGTLVSGNLYRHPVMLAKQAVTVDHLSAGRVEVGIGAGGAQSQFEEFGMPFPATAAERAKRLDEACQMLKCLWTQSKASFHGTYYQLKDAVAEPKPVQQPHPPILIGGRGPLRTLRAAARHAVAWNTSGGGGFEADRQACATLDDWCAKFGRDPRSVRRSIILQWPDQRSGLAFARQYAEIGFTEFVLPLYSTHGDRRALLERFVREGLEQLRSLG
jgi:F420-dependent oxidoreductase-like protein